MFTKVMYYTLLLIFTASCVVMPSNAEFKTKESKETPIAILSTPTKHSAMKIVEPNVVKICPANAKVPITEIGLPDNFRFLAVSENEVLGGNLGTPLSSDIISFSGNSLTPEKIEKIRSLDENSKIINILISPSGLSLTILRWNATSNLETLWISDLSGENQRMIADISPRQRFFWISENEILVVGVPNEADYEDRIPEEEMQPLLSINPATSEIQNLEPLPKGALYVYGSYHTIDGNHYSMYHRDDDQKRNYFLYDYTNRTSIQIFRWLDSPDNRTSIGIRPNGLYFVERGTETGVDFALDLTSDEIDDNESYHDVMKHLSIKDIQALQITSMLSSVTKSDILIMTSDPRDYEKPTPMYLFDYKTNILKDYCIKLGMVSTIFSPDEQFVAFTINEGLETLGYHVIILNLQTGYYSLINDIKALGFGIIK
jgi:hypothetical protein